MTTAVTTTDDIQWPAPVAISPERVISGEPAASTLVLYSDPTTDSGLWKVAPGEFTTKLTGYREFIHIIEGHGQLIEDTGQEIELRTGTVVALPEGWTGRWKVQRELVKSYSIVRTK
ncbi:cupin domain-containing protein [Paenarthrobacter sp. 2TAF44]|uniref:cupin domain-containing protein n=1 Tax=Paenarthrobacter sp. 2TAF44 TaxID=3233018 RepID=UPI003F9949D7